MWVNYDPSRFSNGFLKKIQSQVTIFSLKKGENKTQHLFAPSTLEEKQAELFDIDHPGL